MSLWNPKRHRLLASGYAIYSIAKWTYSNIALIRSKDATVRIWDLPISQDDAAAESSNAPVVLEHLPLIDSHDITALDWNPEGTLIATGSYDSILRIWTARGDFYMSHPQHKVRVSGT